MSEVTKPELKEVPKIVPFTAEWFDINLKAVQDEMSKRIDTIALADPQFMHLKGQFDLLSNQKASLTKE